MRELRRFLNWLFELVTPDMELPEPDENMSAEAEVIVRK